MGLKTDCGLQCDSIKLKIKQLVRIAAKSLDVINYDIYNYPNHQTSKFMTIIPSKQKKNKPKNGGGATHCDEVEQRHWHRDEDNRSIHRHTKQEIDKIKGKY